MKELVNVLTIGNGNHVAETKDAKLKEEGDKSISFSGLYTSWAYCPGRCPWAKTGHCYGRNGNCYKHFRDVSEGKTGTPVSMLPAQVFAKGCGQYVRVNITGDMAIPGTDDLSQEFVDTIIRAYPREFVMELYTYTHCALSGRNLHIMRDAIARGFTINASCERPEQVKKAIANGVPAVLVVKHMPESKLEKDGVTYIKCPNQVKGTNKCAHCKLCMHGDRRECVVFEYHGKRKAPDFLMETV